MRRTGTHVPLKDTVIVLFLWNGVRTINYGKVTGTKRAAQADLSNLHLEMSLVKVPPSQTMPLTDTSVNFSDEAWSYLMGESNHRRIQCPAGSWYQNDSGRCLFSHKIENVTSFQIYLVILLETQKGIHPEQLALPIWKHLHSLQTHRDKNSSFLKAQNNNSTMFCWRDSRYNRL